MRPGDTRGGQIVARRRRTRGALSLAGITGEGRCPVRRRRLDLPVGSARVAAARRRVTAALRALWAMWGIAAAAAALRG